MRRHLFVVVALLASVGFTMLAPAADAGSTVTLGSVPAASSLGPAVAGYWLSGNAAVWGTPFAAAGKIVAFQHRDYIDDAYGSPPVTTGAITFDVWRPTEVSGQFTLLYSSGPISLTNSDTVKTWNVPKGGWSVKSGDYFGVYVDSGGATINYPCPTTCDVDEQFGSALSSHAVGSNYTLYTDSGYQPNVAVSFRARHTR